MPRPRNTSRSNKSHKLSKKKPPASRKPSAGGTAVPYFMLECFQPRGWDDSALFRRPPRLPDDQSWGVGRRFITPPELPIEFTLNDTHSDRLLEMDNTNALIMTKRLLEALREAGVDNLDAYEATIRHPKTGMVSKDYVAVNVVGLVSAADLAASRVVGGMSGGLLDVDFEGVAIDEKRTGGALMFRLAENSSAILVHEKVKAQLLANGFDMLTFVPPESWMG